MRCKMPYVFPFFGVTLYCKLKFTYMILTLRGVGVGDYLKDFIGAEKCFVVPELFMERFEKKY